MILDSILVEKIDEVKELKKPRRSLEAKLAQSELTLIAEIKKASPSKGIITAAFNPEKQLQSYLSGGADAISVLTDKKFFQGGKEMLQEIRKKTDLPVLRKDFIIDPLQIYESFFLGADIILLIAAILGKKELCKLVDLTYSLGMEALVEVHHQKELEKVFSSQARILGINNRNLQDFSVDVNRTGEIIGYLEKVKVRDKYYLISESGIKNNEHINYLKDLGVNGVLIGETLMSASDPAEKIKELFGRSGVLAD
jgi:indole-3-glycerol phosphate synthase